MPRASFSGRLEDLFFSSDASKDCKQETGFYVIAAGDCQLTLLMSLPWGYSSLDDYVQGTIQKIEKEECLCLKVGKFYFHGLDLATEHLIALFQHHLAELFHSIRIHPCLREVKLARNHCSTDGATALSKALSPAAVCKLQSLDLSHQHTERANKLDIEMLASALATNATLTKLNLSFNKINDRDVQAIVTSLIGNQILEELDLRANKIEDVGSQAIAEFLHAQPRLKKLFLFGNPLGDVGGAALLDAIAGNNNLDILNMGYTSRYYNSVQFYACLNRAGRRLLKQTINPSLWPLVLERTAKVSKQSREVCTAADLIFHLLRGSGLLGM